MIQYDTVKPTFYKKYFFNMFVFLIQNLKLFWCCFIRRTLSTFSLNL